jgi:integrase
MPGSIQKRGKNKYLLTVSAGFGVGGKRIRYTRTVEAKSRKEAEKKLALFVAEVEKGLVTDSEKLTLEKFAEKWMTEYAEKQLAPKTVSHYRDLLKRIIPALGHIRLGKLKPMHLIKFYNMLLEDGIRMDGKSGTLSETTVAHYHRLLSSMLNDAVEWQIIADNPAARVKPPKAKKKEISHYDDEKVLLLLQKLEDEPIKYKTAVILTLFTGMRLGELMGLEWADVDFEKCTIRIRQSSQYVKGKGIITKDPKNESSKRIIAVPAEVMELLKTYKKWQNEERLKMGELWEESGRVFTQENGKPMFPDTPSKWFAKFIKKHNLPHITFHGLRHTNATLLISQGTDIKTVSKRLGHAETSTTLNIYSHAIEKADREAAEKLSSLLMQKSSTVNKVSTEQQK